MLVHKGDGDKDRDKHYTIKLIRKNDVTEQFIRENPIYFTREHQKQYFHSWLATRENTAFGVHLPSRMLLERVSYSLVV